MVRYVIGKQNAYLHSNNAFYNAIFSGIGVNLVVYKSLKSAQKRADKVSGYVIAVENGQRLSEGNVVYNSINN